MTLSDPTADNPTFTAPNEPDMLTFTLTVSDSLGMPDPTPDDVVITVQNIPPVSDAGLNQTVYTGVVVTLDGSGSSDPDDDLPLIYLWTQIGGTTVTLSDPTAVSPIFTVPDDPDVLIFTLTVSDSLGMPDPTPDDVVITVEDLFDYYFFPLMFR